MKRTLTRAWHRVKLPDGSMYYATWISVYVVSQVWRAGSHWEWAIIGFAESPTLGPARTLPASIIWRHSTAGTMNEACWYAELAIGERPLMQDKQLNLPDEEIVGVLGW